MIFDAVFDFSIQFTPHVIPHFVRVVNRVPGFVSACDTLAAKREVDGQLAIKFSLYRSPLVKLAAVILCVAATVFLVLIPALESNERVATAVASYFFALWSIRNILSSQIRIFPTLLDCYVLTLCVGMVCVLIWRVHRRWTKRTAQSRLYLPK